MISEPLRKPIAPTFALRKLDKIAYGMSIAVGALGQILFLGLQFGGHGWSYVAASGIAAFAEVTMAASGDWSLEHRAHRRAWRPLLALGVAVSAYAALLNITHFWSTNTSMALMFGGASMVGFGLHVINGHIEVAAYLRLDDEYQAKIAGQLAAEEALRHAQARARELERQVADQAAPEPARRNRSRKSPKRGAAKRTGTAAASRSGTSGTDSGTVPEPAAGTAATSGTGLRLVGGTAPAEPATSSGNWDPELWAGAVDAARRSRAERGSDVRVTDIQELGIRRELAVALRKAVLASGELGSDGSAEAREPVEVGGTE